MKDRKVKSNRAQADYFELLVCQYICYKAGVRFAYSKNIAELSNQILRLPNGKARLELQNNNLIKLTPELDKILDYEITRKGKIIEVIWTGRQLIIKTISDVDIEHCTHKFTKFSVKSIFKSGLGTIRNLGMKSLEKYLSIDFSAEYREMWENLKKYLRIPHATKHEIKKIVLKNEEYLKWATQNGQKYQKKLNNLCYETFNNLPIERKVNFLNFILNVSDPDLYVIIVNNRGVTIYKPIEKRISYQQKIDARENTGVGYTIYIDNMPAYRIQTNATNGIGISPFCQRVFFVEDI